MLTLQHCNRAARPMCTYTLLLATQGVKERVCIYSALHCCTLHIPLAATRSLPGRTKSLYPICRRVPPWQERGGEMSRALSDVRPVPRRGLSREEAAMALAFRAEMVARQTSQPAITEPNRWGTL